jgi:hypothetical protein
MKALVATTIVLAGCLAAGLAGCHREPRVPPTSYEIPQGFSGWVTVEFSVADAAALPDDHGTRLIRIPASGALRTSSPQEIGILDNHFYFVDPAGARTPIDDAEARHGAAPDEPTRRHDHPVVLGFHTGDASGATGRRVFERFYVGTGPAGEPPPGL